MRRTASLLLFGLCWQAAAAAPQQRPPGSAPIPLETPDVTFEGGAAIRLLPPRQRVSGGPTLVETLLLDPEIRQVVFYVDGELRDRRKRPPWRAKVKLAIPPREQVVSVEALDLLDRVVGRDQITFNKIPKRLRVAIRGLDRTDNGVRVAADVSIPDEVTLTGLDVYLNERRLATVAPDELPEGRLDVPLESPDLGESDFVRVVANLADGRSIEDTRLVSETVFQEEIDVQLVQLQVLVTDKQGRPMKGFQRDHFKIFDRGGAREPAGLFRADDVSLLLGYAVDSSGSMRPIWDQTMAASRMFLDATVTDRDEGFLIDFDWTIRLVQGRTGDKRALEAGLAKVQPEGGTALYDSVLFALLQFDRQQGRRGLVVLTDGFDVDSRSDPNRAVEFARRLGVPIYIVAMEVTDPVPGPPSQAIGPPSGPPPSRKKEAAAMAELKLLTDPSGGRLIRVRSLEQMRRALAQINAEMRNQYVLTYYTDTPPEPGRPPRVEVTVEGMKGLEARAVLGADRIY